jgi:hypothetical protein
MFKSRADPASILDILSVVLAVVTMVWQIKKLWMASRGRVLVPERRPSTSRPRGRLVWHYTSLDVLALILDSDCLVATEVSFQNDIRGA